LEMGGVPEELQAEPVNRKVLLAFIHHNAYLSSRSRTSCTVSAALLIGTSASGFRYFLLRISLALPGDSQKRNWVW
jgi:hypothetical protein